LEDLNVEIHLPKEGQIISKDAKSQAKLIHGIQVVIARNFIENLKEEVRKGMREKAEQGIYPSRPPLGYRNNKIERTIEVDPEKAPIARRMFELYATGDYSLSSLRRAIIGETGLAVAKGYLERLLKNPFYAGQFTWDHKMYQGTHMPLIGTQLFQRVQGVLRGYSKPKHHGQKFAFSGLLRCAYHNCMVTAEIKKGKYIYYHCTGYRGKCLLPYFREEELSDRLASVFRDIRVPDNILNVLQEAFLQDQFRVNRQRQEQRSRLEQHLAVVRRRLDQAYVDKLDGKITEDFWVRKAEEWRQEAQEIQLAIREIEEAEPNRNIDRVRILELANKAHFLYVRQNHLERGRLLRIVLSNCLVDAVSLYPTYRKPFDLILGAAKTGEWYARRDSNSRPPCFVGSPINTPAFI
jgi:site-specific DNA recombinase